jgi:hypothetical protein
MRRICLPIFALLAAAAPPPPGDSRDAAPALTYADSADLALAAPVAAQVRIVEADVLKDEQAAGVPAGLARFYVEADMVSLIRAPGPLPARTAYLVDLPRDSKGKAPRLKKGMEFLILAAPVPERPGELRLVAPDAQLPFTPAEAERLRAIVREAAGPSAPPRITGLGKAFHVPGAIPGESETQIFLQTADARPVSLSVLRRPGQTPQWAVALSEIVDEAAEPPAPGTLLWYRLACTLPPRLPAQSLGDADSEGAAATQADYRLVLERLGPCLRNRRAH